MALDLALAVAFALDLALAVAFALDLAFAVAFARILLHRILDAHKNRPRGSEKRCNDITVEGIL